MKNYLFAALFLSVSLLKAQVQMPTEKNIAIDRDTTTLGEATLIGLPEAQIFLGRTLLYRHKFKDSNKTKFEYIRLEKDTFLYVEYGKEGNIIKSGRTYLSENCPRVDTSFYATETETKIEWHGGEIKYCLPSKFGFWYETDGYGRLSGFFAANKRTGVWQYQNYKGLPDEEGVPNHKDFTYLNDTLISERQLNILRLNNTDSLTKYLTNRFFDVYGVSYRVFDKKNQPSFYQKEYVILELLADKNFIYQKFKNNAIVEEKKGQWKVSLRHLQLDIDSKIFLKYKLNYVVNEGFSFDTKGK